MHDAPEADALPDGVEDDLQLLRSAAVAAGILVTAYFRKEVRFWDKSNSSPVSEADVMVNRFLEETLGGIPGILEMIGRGLAALDDLACPRNADGFAALPRAERRELLERLAAAEDCFPPALVLHVLGAYYQHPRVLSALGLDPRPPHPDGYRMAPDDLALLEPVRRRPRMYRSI